MPGGHQEFVVVIPNEAVLAPRLLPGRVGTAPFRLPQQNHPIIEAVPALEEQTELRRPDGFLAPVVNGVSQTAAPCTHAHFDVAAGRQQSFGVKLLRAACG